jgi:hypothetical protein
MPKSSKTDYSKIDIDDVLAQRGQVAVIWGIEDVQAVRPDLNDDQSWEVLLQCSKVHDCEVGFTWVLIETVADSMFASPEDSDTTEEGDRP